MENTAVSISLTGSNDEAPICIEGATCGNLALPDYVRPFHAVFHTAHSHRRPAVIMTPAWTKTTRRVRVLPARKSAMRRAYATARSSRRRPALKRAVSSHHRHSLAAPVTAVYGLWFWYRLRKSLKTLGETLQTVPDCVEDVRLQVASESEIWRCQITRTNRPFD